MASEAEHPSDRAEGDRDEAEMARVLLAAGQRPRPPEDVVRAVRAAVREEWRSTVAARAQRRRWTALAAAASVAALALALWAASPLWGTQPPVLARVVHASGPVEVDAGVWYRQHAVGEREALRAGDELSTGSEGRVALELTDGTSVRLDHGTRVELDAAGHLVLSRGALYVDAGPELHRGAGLEIETPLLSVRHIGTRYEVRVLPGQVRVSVREGRVQIEPQRGGLLEGDAGERLLVSSAGDIERSEIVPYDSQWQWAAEAAPAMDIDGRPLLAFLDWAGHELGRPVVFASPQAHAAAADIELSGSVAGLSVSEALAAVLSTTPLRGHEQQGVLLIEASAAR